MPFINRFSTAEVSLTAGQSIVIASYGGGETKIYTAPYNTTNDRLATNYAPYSTPVIVGTSIYITAVSAMNVKIEASSGSEVEYHTGTAPALRLMPNHAVTSITAFAGGGQANATQLKGNINRVTTVASANDSVKLPSARAGARVTVFNSGVGTCAIFPQTSESIGAGATNASFLVATGKGADFACPVDGFWTVVYSA